MANDPEAISDHLASQREAAPEELQQDYFSIEDLWERKLWHQLTDTLVAFYQKPQSAPQRISLFKTFVLSFAEKLNQLRFVIIGLNAASQCSSMFVNLMIRPKLNDRTQTTTNASPSSQTWPRGSTSHLHKKHSCGPRLR